jgi:DNA-binding LacI/PurR family transcriptional regulator
VIGVIVSSIADPFFSEILFGIEECALEGGYSLFIAASQNDPGRERKIVQTMMEQRTDGVIICSSSFSSEQGRQLLAYGFPIVVVNHQGAENFNFSIYHDDIDGSRQVTRHLIELGHKRIAYLGNSLSGRTTQDRLNGFQTEMDKADLAIPGEFIHHVNGGEPKYGLEGLEYFLQLKNRPTAVVCFNDLLAIGVLKGCAQKGIKVPGELSVTGFDNIVYSAFTTPALTTLDQPKRSIGEESAQLLLNLLNPSGDNSSENSKTKVLKGRLLVRDSTAAASIQSMEQY